MGVVALVSPQAIPILKMLAYLSFEFSNHFSALPLLNAMPADKFLLSFSDAFDQQIVVLHVVVDLFDG